MTTFGDLIEECLSYLNGFGDVRDKVTSLSGAISSSATTFTVADGRQIDRGYIEIGSEMMAVKSVDSTTGAVTLHPWGRGVRGTTAVAHSDGAMVVDTPRFPRSKVMDETNVVISLLYPDLFDVTLSESNSVNPTRVTYPLPADCESVIRVQYQAIGPSQMWTPITRYKVDYNADPTAFPTGKSLDIYAGMTPGRTIKILYRRKFLSFASETDTFASVYLSENYRDIIRLMVVGRLLLSQDPGRIEMDSVESSQRAPFVQVTTPTSVAKNHLALAQQRVAQERRRLLTLYPSTQVRMS